jgi:hypothetical protein
MTLSFNRKPLEASPASASGELGLGCRERFVLAVGIHAACALIAIVDRPSGLDRRVRSSGEGGGGDSGAARVH